MINLKVNKINSWGKGFLTSVLGTTVSILLTFGTSALVDEKMKADIQRQTAMMVIHDIDECIKQMEEMAEEEEKRNNAIQYVLAHLDQIDSLSADTLETAIDMFIEYGADLSVFDDAKENIFKSSQDIWRNLDNMAFIDNMEQFYQERKEFSTYLATDPAFRHPISYEEYCQMRINATSDVHNIDNVAVLKEKLKDRKIKYYIDFSVARTRYYRMFAQRWKNISDRNKFIMDISDEELAAYIKNSQRSGSSVGKRDMTGQWERIMDGTDVIYYEFLENDSFRRKRVGRYPYPTYNGDILVTRSYSGTWSLKNDTLFMVFDPKSAAVEIDTSQITYRLEMRDSVRNFINKHYGNVKEMTENLRKAIEEDQVDTFPVTTNKARDKIEMVVSGSSDEIETRYMKRIKDSDVFKK